MDDSDKPQRVADYFVVAGLGNFAKPANVDGLGEDELGVIEPITDLAVIFKSHGEKPPPGFVCIDTTPAGFSADLNHGSIRQPSCFLCYRRGTDKPPITDIGVLYEGKERLMAGCDIIEETPTGKSANVNNSGGSRTFITYRRASPHMAHNSLAVTEINVILQSKGETTPHAFCLIERNLNKGMVGSDVYLCYRKSLARSHSIIYKAEILSRFPPVDHPGLPLPERVAMFCLPQGAIVECWPEKSQLPLPIFSSFVLTGALGQKVYGASVTFFEQLQNEKFSDEMKTVLRLDKKKKAVQGRQVAHTNKCICVLSHWPFFQAFRKFLSQLYRISMSSQPIPIERYIANLMLDVPFPSPQRPRILVQMTLYDPFEIQLPYHSPLPVSGASYTEILRCLGSDNLLLIFYLVLTERKILIHSLRPALLTSVAEAMTTILFPFSWQCPYIPLCPVALNEILCAPCPFIVGIDSRYFDQYDPPGDVTCVDLDTSMVTLASEIKPANWKSLPKKPGKALKDRMDELYYQVYQFYHREKDYADITDTAIELAPLEHDSSTSRKRLAIEVAIQEAFLRFNGTIMRGYGSYLRPITARPTEEACDLKSLFNLTDFLKSRTSSVQKFFQQFVWTQMFSRFIEQRSFVTGQDSLYAFFDDTLENLDSPSPLVEVDASFIRGSQRTYVVTPLDSNIRPEKDKLYSYPCFPVLDQELFRRYSNTPSIHSFTRPQVSPVGIRPIPELHQSIMWAKKNSSHPIQWSKCLLAYCYSLWFIHLPSYIKSHHNKAKVLHVAFEVLCKMQKNGIKLPDEVCYRVLMQLCGQFGHPALAVKVFFEMKRQGITPNAVTYGYYNRAVIEGKWPKDTTSAHMWNKLRNFFAAVYEFRKGLRRKMISSHGSCGSLTGSCSDLENSDSPRKIKQRSLKASSRTSSRERLLPMAEEGQTLMSQETSHRQRTNSEMSTLSEFNDVLDSSMNSVDGAGLSRKSSYVRTFSETSIASFEGGFQNSQLFISNEGSDQSEPYEYTTQLLDDVIFGLPHGLQPNTALEAQVCSCCQCVKCGRWIFDEQIMAGWTADDNNLNTTCPYCSTSQVGSLSVKIKDYRNCFSSRPSSDVSASLTSLGSVDLNVTKNSPDLTNTQELDDYFNTLSSSAPTAHEVNNMAHKFITSPPRSSNSISISQSPSNPISIRSSHHRNRCVSAPTSANASPTSSMRNSPLLGNMLGRSRNSNSMTMGSTGGSYGGSYGGSWYVTRAPEERDSLTITFVSPLVLRKELENMLENDGDIALQSPEVVEKKSVIFWNVVWYFKRLDLPSHLPELLLSNYPSLVERSERHLSEERRSSHLGSQVLISTSWDGDRQISDSFIPLYMLWNSPGEQQGSLIDSGVISRSVMQTVVAHIKNNDVFMPMVILLDERSRQKSVNPSISWSVYRELLFLSITACGAEHIDCDAFDRSYKRAFKRLMENKEYCDKLLPEDKPASPRSIYCRRYFHEPVLQPKLPNYSSTNTPFF